MQILKDYLKTTAKEDEEDYSDIYDDLGQIRIDKEFYEANKEAFREYQKKLEHLNEDSRDYEYPQLTIEERKRNMLCRAYESYIERAKLEKELVDYMRQMKIQELEDMSLVDERYKNITFEDCNLNGVDNSFKLAYERCKKYAENFGDVYDKGLGMYLFGPAGCGKTHLCACIANYLRNQKLCSVVMTSISTITQKIMESYKKKSDEEESEILESVSQAHLLILDDLGIERLTQDNFMQEKLYTIINTRYGSKKPTIFTSNYSMSELASKKGIHSRTIDRIAEMSNAIIEIKGESYRLKQRKKTELPF